MDCWWNAAIENQGVSTIIADFTSFTESTLAIDRVHRIGQEKTVFVTHFIVCFSTTGLGALLTHCKQISNTIEGRVLKIQKRKTAIVKEAFKGQGEKDSESLENLKIMFDED